ncbi:MAG: Nif3-like dinuclear metal center hexameric protein, partial [Bacteroidales bacterium]
MHTGTGCGMAGGWLNAHGNAHGDRLQNGMQNLKKTSMQNLKLQEIIQAMETWAPLFWQEEYDNSGLSLGDPNQIISKALLCLDITPSIVDEAIESDAQLIISHHPAIFHGLKKIDPSTAFGEMLQKSLRHGIAWYSAHTNLDNTLSGVNSYIADSLNLKNRRPLQALTGLYGKLQVYVPVPHSEKLIQALTKAGCGQYKNYDSCLWQTLGQGQFRALENAHPFVGNIQERHIESEVKLEMLYPLHLQTNIIKTLLENHPYEEVAYDLIPLLNQSTEQGAGLLGELPSSYSEEKLLKTIKEITKIPFIRH